MLNKKMAQALNEQINKEMYSAYLYMSMSAYSANIGLKGFANWFMVQYHEEMYHAMKLYEYVQRQGEDVKLDTIKARHHDIQQQHVWTIGFDRLQCHDGIDDMVDMTIACIA